MAIHVRRPSLVLTGSALLLLASMLLVYGCSAPPPGDDDGGQSNLTSQEQALGSDSSEHAPTKMKWA
jgi:hypothetical protein